MSATSSTNSPTLASTTAPVSRRNGQQTALPPSPKASRRLRSVNRSCSMRGSQRIQRVPTYSNSEKQSASLGRPLWQSRFASRQLAPDRDCAQPTHCKRKSRLTCFAWYFSPKAHTRTSCHRTRRCPAFAGLALKSLCLDISTAISNHWIYLQLLALGNHSEKSLWPQKPGGGGVPRGEVPITPRAYHVRWTVQESVMPVKTIIEPFRIKSVEPIRWTTRAQREELLKAAH